MSRNKLVLAALLAAVAAPASAAVFVIGNTDARLCFEAADSPLMPQFRHVRNCDEALLHEALTDHDRVATHVNRGILRLRRNLVDEAVADFDRAIQLDPEQPEAYLNKGAALIRRQNPAEALQLFTISLERHTRRPAVAHYGRAVANEALGNLAAAYRDYRRASELDPDWEDPRAELTRFRVVGQN